MAKRKVSNPLALAVLTQLSERPMHPYEMASTMRERGKDLTVKLNYGSLYTVVDALQRAGFIAARETERDGRRPERTVYEITEAGAAEARDWLRELLGKPVKEYPRFLAGLTFMPVLPPEEVMDLLRERNAHLEEEIRSIKSDLRLARTGSQSHPPLPRLFVIEGEYVLAMREAELRWVGKLIHDLETETFDGLDQWRYFQEVARHKQEGAERT
jgi:DNA-binding PadR family transcriptional regulator